MYKKYEKGNCTILQHSFDSIADFIDHLDNGKINSKLLKTKQMLSSEKKDFGWYKSNSLKEAKELCKFGYHEGFEKLMNLKLQLEKYIKLSNHKNKQFNYYIGYTPDVKAYLEGDPLSMLNKQQPTRKHIDIYYNIGVSCITSINQIYNRGVITLCLVEILENMGYNVNLNLFDMGQSDIENVNQEFNLFQHQNDELLITYHIFKFKKTNERLNIQKLYFPLCHPSFLRRLIFRLMEQTSDLPIEWYNGYGFPSPDICIRKVLDLKENDIVICSPDEMGVMGSNIIDDANAMFDYINDFTNEKLELNHIKQLKIRKFSNYNF